MYLDVFDLKEPPFSITPDPRFVYFSGQHRDALAHLKFGIGQGGGGGFVQLTGDVGTGKTTLCRLLLSELDAEVRVALILNPLLEPKELVAAILTELGLKHRANESARKLVERLNEYLLQAYSDGLRVVVIIDEAQLLSVQALEQVRLLTNLETATQKLLQIVLLGQPELRERLRRPGLSQLSQRITARFHLAPLRRAETTEYIQHRIKVAGGDKHLFSRPAIALIHRRSGGVPRLINVICDRCLLAAYAEGKSRVSRGLAVKASAEVLDTVNDSNWRRLAVAVVATFLLLVAAASMWISGHWAPPSAETQAVATPAAKTPVTGAVWSAAVQRLLRDWHVATDRIPARCQDLQVGRLRCQVQHGNFARIAVVGRPVILKLAEQSYLPVLGLDAESATVAVGNSLQRVDRSEIESQWLGEYYDVWMSPVSVAQPLKPGDEHPDVVGVKLLAQVADPAFTGPVDRRFDPSFAQWVRSFQTSHGLRADAIVGPDTLYFLSQFDQQGPQLEAARSLQP